VTDGVLAALEVALERHELLKLKVSGEAEVGAAKIAPRLTKATKSQLVQIIGHTLVLYRRRDENPKIVLPRTKPAKAVAKTAASAKAARVGKDESDDDDDDLEDEDFDDEDESDDESDDDDELE